MREATVYDVDDIISDFANTQFQNIGTMSPANEWVTRTSENSVTINASALSNAMSDSTW